MGKYTCPECLTSGSWHYDEDGAASRCPNYLSTVQHDEAVALTKAQRTHAFEAAKQIVRDFAETHQEFSSNDTAEAMEAAQIPSPTVGPAFAAVAEEGDIENTGRQVRHRDKHVRSWVFVWLSKKHPAYVANHSSPFVAAGVSRSTGRREAS